MVDKPEDVWQKAMENALVYGTGFVRFDSMGGISVVDPKDYHYLEKKEWVGYTNEDRERIVPMLVQSLINHDEKTMAGLLNAILIDIEQQLKEKNGG